MDRVSQVSAEICENYMEGGGSYFTGQKGPAGALHTQMHNTGVSRYGAMNFTTPWLS